MRSVDLTRRHTANNYQPMTAERSAEILLAEDNPGDVRLIEKALEDWQVPVHLTVADDGERALEILRGEGARRGLPDLVILDLNLPKLDGREVLTEIKTDPALQHLPVIVLTSSTSPADILASYRLHANCFLTKPANFSKLETLLKGIEHFWLTLAQLPKVN